MCSKQFASTEYAIIAAYQLILIRKALWMPFVPMARPLLLSLSLYLVCILIFRNNCRGAQPCGRNVTYTHTKRWNVLSLDSKDLVYDVAKGMERFNNNAMDNL